MSATTQAQTQVFTNDNAWETADLLNALVEDGATKVNGHDVTTRYTAKVADGWQNGSVSINVKARGRSLTGVNVIWVKAGQVITVS